VVKETGHEFVYRNEVMKFRNIALRGPWTSGGIEFNFGIIGHTPATATPVDYVLKKNADGSVSCFVGAMDLPSRTQWRVEVRLPADRAYFETNVLWFNPTPLEQPYYNWMTAAASARDDLEMTIPGDAYLTHPGEARPWPVDDEGRFLPLYRNNSFGGHKSYHVVGELNDFFGGYYHDDDYGFGHWARYEDMPGQKLWLWALSRQGGVWEDLLTDTDGQYIEFQAGRLFVQYSPDGHVNPVTQAGFPPLSASRWSETWFPLEGIGGLTDASRDGAMHLSGDDGLLTVNVIAFAPVHDTLRVWAGDRLVLERPAEMAPLDRFGVTVDLNGSERYRVQLDGLGLDYDSDPSDRRLSRPFATDPEATSAIPEVDRTVFEARELQKARRYSEARELFASALTREPWHREALLGMADLHYRAGSYADALERVRKTLQRDAYDARANFVAGLIYRALGQTADARDAFGWAARSPAYRAAAYAELAEIMVTRSEWVEAERYARLSLDFDRHGVPGWRVLAVLGRIRENRALASEAIRHLLELDPLHHFALAERHLGAADATSARRFAASLRGEYSGQTLLELAVEYAELGREHEALAILAVRADGPLPAVHLAWKAFLLDDPGILDEGAAPDFQFPYRRESLPVLEWADARSDDWVWSYLRGLNLWAVGRADEARPLFAGLGDSPAFAPFYVARAQLASLGGHTTAAVSADYRRAVALDAESRILHVFLVRHLQDSGAWGEALEAVRAARQRFPADFTLALLEARTLVEARQGRRAVEILESVEVLPSEGARESHRLWTQAHLWAAVQEVEQDDLDTAAAHLRAALEWPESLGQGRPYEPEERLVRYVLGAVEQSRGNALAARTELRKVVGATDPERPSRLDLLGVGALWRLAPEDVGQLTSGGKGSEADRAQQRLIELERNGGATPEQIQALGDEFPTVFGDVDGRILLTVLAWGLEVP